MCIPPNSAFKNDVINVFKLTKIQYGRFKIASEILTHTKRRIRIIDKLRGMKTGKREGRGGGVRDFLYIISNFI